MKLLPQQKEAVRATIEGWCKLLYLVGGIRSGKSVVATYLLMWMLNRLAKRRLRGQFILAGHSVESVRTNIIVPYLIPFMQQRRWKFKDLGGSRPRIEAKGQEILVFGGADRRSENRMRGMSASGGLVDEVAKVDESFFFQVLERCSHNDAKVITTTNKRGNWDWEKQKIVDNLDSMQGMLFEFELADNTFLDPNYITWITGALGGHYNKRDIQNLYAEATGLVYTDYKVIDESLVPLPWYQLPKFLGVDWAQSGPTAGVALVEIPGQPNKYLAIDEYYASNEQMQLDHHGHASAMAVKLPNIIEVRNDPNAPYMQQAFERLGIYCLPGENDVLEGLAAIHGALFRGDIIISSRCQNLLRELAGYAWREQTKGGVEEHPIKKNDHAADALRYIGTRLFPIHLLHAPVTPAANRNPAGVLSGLRS